MSTKYTKQFAVSASSYKILNKLKEKAVTEKGIKPRQYNAGEDIDKALLLLAEKEGVIINA